MGGSIADHTLNVANLEEVVEEELVGKWGYSNRIRGDSMDSLT